MTKTLGEILLYLLVEFDTFTAFAVTWAVRVVTVTFVNEFVIAGHEQKTEKKVKRF